MASPALGVGRRYRTARVKRWFLGALIALAALTAAAVVGMHFAARTLKDRIARVLGPESTVAEVRVQLASIEILDVEVPAPKGWPTRTALSAGRIVAVPELRQIFSDRIHIRRIDIEDAQIAVLRPQQGGLKVLP